MSREGKTARSRLKGFIKGETGRVTEVLSGVKQMGWR